METVLIVDDAEINRELLKYVFDDEYKIIEAGDGETAIELIDSQKDEIALILLDLVMPVKSGMDVLEHMRAKDLINKIPVILITGEATSDSDLKAYEYGAADIIYKPFTPKVVKRRGQNIIELYQQRTNMEKALEKRAQQLRESQRKLKKNNEFLINALGSVVEFRSAESGEHVQRVSTFTKRILVAIKDLYPEYKLTDSQISVIANAAAIHDVGKIAIPDNILNKPGKLTPEEFDEMKKHTVYGCEILERFKQDDSDFYQYCFEICRWHHEKYDGGGYPDGLKGDEIPIWAQAASLADCFDALCSKRVYKEAFTTQTAFDMIMRGECGAFSDKILHAFQIIKDELFYLVDNKFKW